MSYHGNRKFLVPVRNLVIGKLFDITLITDEPRIAATKFAVTRKNGGRIPLNIDIIQ